MEHTPTAIYQDNIDKQRIVIAGADRSKLGRIITEVLHSNNRKFDHFANGKLTKVEDAPIIIIESPSTELTGYQHHIGILTTAEPHEMDQMTKFADASPKSGILIYPENDSQLKAIGTKERSDIQIISYKIIPHEVKDGKTYLVSSTKEKFFVRLSGNQNLVLLGAAKELLKKIGISSGQFYRAVSNLE
jgi:UDP-N-acetylmuramate: L-alanyl-gamma-D-glutamyl-meso-diaminopimelate ligase